jgi:DNA-binding NtrC family response regulator
VQPTLLPVRAGPAAGRRFDIALLDLMMPGMDGAALYAEMKRVRAGTAALLVTAYPGHPRAEAAQAAETWRVLPKPVDMGRLLGLMEEAAGQPLVLVVDDDADLCASLWDVLREHGFRACLAHDAATAVARVREDGYRVILLDMKLPDGDGSQVFQSARGTVSAGQVVVMTGHQAETEPRVEKLRSEGAGAVLRKLIDVPALLATLRKLTAEEPSE